MASMSEPITQGGNLTDQHDDPHRGVAPIATGCWLVLFKDETYFHFPFPDDSE